MGNTAEYEEVAPKFRHFRWCTTRLLAGRWACDRIQPWQQHPKMLCRHTPNLMPRHDYIRISSYDVICESNCQCYFDCTNMGIEQLEIHFWGTKRFLNYTIQFVYIFFFAENSGTGNFVKLQAKSSMNIPPLINTKRAQLICFMVRSIIMFLSEVLTAKRCCCKKFWDLRKRFPLTASPVICFRFRF